MEMTIDYDKEFTCGETTITRADYESLPAPMKTLSISDEEMEELAERIEYEMSEWREWRDNGDVSEDRYQEHWWEIMEELGFALGMTYYEEFEDFEE